MVTQKKRRGGSVESSEAKKRRRSKSVSSDSSSSSGSSSLDLNTRCHYCTCRCSRTPYQSPWVQCGECEKWFHHYCLGIPAAAHCGDWDFICEICSPHPEWREVAAWRSSLMRIVPTRWAKEYPPSWLPSKIPRPPPITSNPVFDLVASELEKGLRENIYFKKPAVPAVGLEEQAGR